VKPELVIRIKKNRDEKAVAFYDHGISGRFEFTDHDLERIRARHAELFAQ
jgi:hypothetical protein